MRAIRTALFALAAALLFAAPGHAAAPVKVSAPNNANFARSLVVAMPGYTMPPAGQWKMELRRRPGAPVDFTFSTAIGNLRVTAVDAPAKKVTLALLGPQPQIAALSGAYVADLLYWEGSETAKLGDFAFTVTPGVTAAPALATPAYDDLAAWGPIIDLSSAAAPTVLAMYERGLTGPQGPAGPPGATDHGALTGLADDDHPQYLTTARGDARYSQQGHGHAAGDVSGLAPVATTGAYADLSGRPALGAAAALGVGAGLSSSGGSIVLGGSNGLVFDATARTLALSGGTVTADNPVVSVGQSWNNAAVNFTGVRVNVTDAASGASSNLLDLQVGGASRFKVDKNGAITAGASSNNTFGNSIVTGYQLQVGSYFYAYMDRATVHSGGLFGWSPNAGASTTPDVTLYRDAADTMAQRRGANAQRVNFYSSYTDAANLVRGYIDAGKTTSGVLAIGSESIGTSGAKLTKMRLDVDGVSRADYGVTTANAWTFSGGVSCSGAPSASFAVVGGIVTHC